MTFCSKVYELDNEKDNCDEEIKNSAPLAFEGNGGEGNVRLDGV